MIPGNINTDLISGDEGAYQVERSLRFNSADSAYLSRTPASAGNRKTWTWSGWVKRSGLGTYQRVFNARNPGVAADYIRFNNDDTLELYFGATLITAQVFRDVSSWYHLTVAVDTTQATSSNRVKLYVNGTQVTAFGTTNYPSQNADTLFNATLIHNIGTGDGTTEYFSGYLANVEFVDGSALTPASFGETNATTGQWVPKAYTGSYGTNGFKLSFSNNASTTTISQDSSGNNNHWTANNISVTAGAGNDSLVDTPTSYGTDTGAGGEVRGNYATLNPLVNFNGSTLSNGNLDITCVSLTGQWRTQKGGWGFYGGKFYFEATLNAGGSAGNSGIGIGRITLPHSGNTYPGQSVGSYAYTSDGSKIDSGSASYPWSTWTVGDVIGVAADLTAGTVAFYKNGTLQGSMTGLDTTLTYEALVGSASGTPSQYSLNFGQRPFAYTAPSGFKALCTANLPAPTIVKPSTVMDVKLYTGNGSTQTISGLGFSPDLVWMKVRSIGYNHTLIDSVRGATKTLSSSMTVQEYTEPTGPTAFTSDGWSMSGDVTYVGSVNANGQTYAGWCWDAGSSTVTNTAGSISSQVRANASAGFSIVTLTYSSSGTVGHGLGVAPAFIIKKNRGSVAAGYENWHCYHSSLGDLGYIMLNSTAAAGSAGFGWGANSTTFNANAAYFSSGTFVCYCFAPVAGYSSFGSYTGNGSADGPFVYTGFRPRWVLIKGSSFATTGWAIYDAVRNTFNVANNLLTAESSSAETNYPEIDLLSNGFKLRGTNPTWNYSGQTHIYCAFAESPLQYARAR
jgi:hypothetical protein